MGASEQSDVINRCPSGTDVNEQPIDVLKDSRRAVALTWETDVNQIMAYASGAFALYYVLQSVVAFVVARQQKELDRRPLRLATFVFLAVMCLLVFVLGIPSG